MLVAFADWIEYPVRGCFAQIAYTTKVVSDPPALFTSAAQPLSAGYELLTLAPSWPELTNTPPPQTTVRAGHVLAPCVCDPSSAAREPVLTTVYRLGIVDV
jgi:hypothetical protein